MVNHGIVCSELLRFIIGIIGIDVRVTKLDYFGTESRNI